MLSAHTHQPDSPRAKARRFLGLSAAWWCAWVCVLLAAGVSHAQNRVFVDFQAPDGGNGSQQSPLNSLIGVAPVSGTTYHLRGTATGIDAWIRFENYSITDIAIVPWPGDTEPWELLTWTDPRDLSNAWVDTDHLGAPLPVGVFRLDVAPVLAAFEARGFGTPTIRGLVTNLEDRSQRDAIFARGADPIRPFQPAHVFLRHVPGSGTLESRIAGIDAAGSGWLYDVATQSVYICTLDRLPPTGDNWHAPIIGPRCAVLAARVGPGVHVSGGRIVGGVRREDQEWEAIRSLESFGEDTLIEHMQIAFSSDDAIASVGGANQIIRDCLVLSPQSRSDTGIVIFGQTGPVTGLIERCEVARPPWIDVTGAVLDTTGGTAFATHAGGVGVVEDVRFERSTHYGYATRANFITTQGVPAPGPEQMHSPDAFRTHAIECASYEGGDLGESVNLPSNAISMQRCFMSFGDSNLEAFQAGVLRAESCVFVVEEDATSVIGLRVPGGRAFFQNCAFIIDESFESSRPVSLVAGRLDEAHHITLQDNLWVNNSDVTIRFAGRWGFTPGSPPADMTMTDAQGGPLTEWVFSKGPVEWMTGATNGATDLLSFQNAHGSGGPSYGSVDPGLSIQPAQGAAHPLCDSPIWDVVTGAGIGPMGMDGGAFAGYFGPWQLEPCDPDFNADGNLNDQDWFDFTNAYFNATVGDADFNRDGSENDQDFFDFANAYFNQRN